MAVYNSEFILGSTCVGSANRQMSRSIGRSYCCDVVLRQMLLPDIRAATGSKFLVFQHDIAPSHRAKDTVTMLDQGAPDFIPPAVWPPYSPDLNPVDYEVWNVLQERVYRTKILDVDELK